MATPTEIRGLEKRLAHPFQNASWIEAALTHSSLLNEPRGKGRQASPRLAHLGDAVVELAVRGELFRRFPTATKGGLDKAKQPLVENASLARSAEALGLVKLVDRATGQAENQAVLAEAFEAVIAAVFLDSDFETAAVAARRFISFPTEIPAKGDRV